VERKSLADLAGSLLSGRLTYALAELSALPRAALVVEERYSRIFKLEHASGGAVAEALAEAQARFPSVPIMFAETRPLAEEWTYRYLGAALTEAMGGAATGDLEARLGAMPAHDDDPVPPAGPSPAAVRHWATANGLAVADRGRIPAAVLRAYESRAV